MVSKIQQDEEQEQQNALSVLANQVIEFVTLEDLQKQTLELKDLFGVSPHDILDVITSTDEKDPTAVSILFDDAPPSDGNVAQKDGFQQAKIIQQKSLALHWAAKKGDINEIARLVEQEGYDVNKEDVLSGRPLFVAAFFGKIAAVKYLIQHGADVQDDSYTGQTALHAAIYKHHYDVARILVEEGKALPNRPDMNEKTPINMVHDRIRELINGDVKNLQRADVKEEVKELLTTLQVFAKYCPPGEVNFSIEQILGQKEPTGTQANFLSNMLSKLVSVFKKDTQSDLHQALDNQNFALARKLVQSGEALPNKALLNKELPINFIINKMSKLLTDNVQALKTPEKALLMNELIQTMEVFANYSGKDCHYIVNAADYGTVAKPVSMYLKLFATRSPTIELRDKFNQLGEKIASYDMTEKLYVNAKNLLNSFPTEGLYELSLGKDKTILVQTNGHFSYITTHWASESIKAFTAKLKAENTDTLKIEIFNKLCGIFETADILKSNAEIEQYSQDVLKKYQQGETILLPTGWDTHFMDAVISKTQELFVSGNTGERYDEFAPGLLVYQMNNPNLIDADFIHDTTTNQSQMVLEQDKMLEYELIAKVDEQIKPEQEFGNCTWLSHSHGVQACAYIELLNKGLDNDQAKKLASDYTLEWERFHGIFQIDQYMQEGAGLSVDALTSIIIDLNSKGVQEQTETNKLHAQKLTDLLSTPLYKAEFQSWLNTSSKKSGGQTIKAMFEQFGAKVSDEVALGEDTRKGSFDFAKPITKLFSNKELISDKSQSSQEEAGVTLANNSPAACPETLTPSFNKAMQQVMPEIQEAAQQPVL